MGLTDPPPLDLDTLPHLAQRPTPPASLQERYVIDHELGRGGMGVVLLARDQKLGRNVALKVLPRGAPADALIRFEQEARAAAALNHPNVLAVHDIGVSDGQPYIVSELLEGQTLRERLSKGALPRRDALDYAAQLARGLEAAHERGIVHRDLKPENLFITNEGRIKILDFGIAKLPRGETTTQTADGIVMGTVGYMSPEQVRGEAVDARSDIFSFGAILYEMLAGKPAFVRATAVDSCHAVVHEEPPDADAIVRRCIAKNPARRYQTARELAADLGAPKRARGLLWFALALATATPAAGIWLQLRRPPPPPSVAVLPFVNMSSDKDTEYFSDGITEELINALANVDGLKVPARTSAFAMRGKDLTVQQIADRLGVAHVLEGSVRRDGDKLRITAQLINAADGYHLWSKTYDREVKSIFAIEDEIAHAIASSLRRKLIDVKAPTMNAKAHELYLKGLFLLNQRTPEALAKAAGLFEDATRRDPDYALAYAAEADALSLQTWYSGNGASEELLHRAEAAATRATQLDANLGEAHASLGLIAFARQDLRLARVELRKAAELNPNDANIRDWLGSVYQFAAHFDEAKTEYERARELDPASLIIGTHVAAVTILTRRYAAAIKELRSILELDSRFAVARIRLVEALALDGHLEEALAEMASSSDVMQFTDFRAVILGVCGKRDEARALLMSIPESELDDTVAVAWVALGDADKAFAVLQRVCREGRLLPLSLSHPVMDRIRRDPRFPPMERCASARSF